MGTPVTQSITLVRITKVRAKGRHGGVLLTGKEVDDRANQIGESNYTVVEVPAKIAGSGIFFRDEVWKVIGIDAVRAGVNNGFEYTENVIKAISIERISTGGGNFVQEVAYGNEYIGIGEVKARQLWVRHGNAIFDILANKEIEKLVPPLTPRVAENLIKQWGRKDLAKTVRWLEEGGISGEVGSQVVKFYGKATTEKIEQNPYRLIPFSKTWEAIDELAQREFGIQPNDPRRLQAGVEYSLYEKLEKEGNGHTVFTQKQVRTVLKNVLNDSRLVSVALEEPSNGGFYKDKHYLYPAGSYLREQYVAERLFELCKEGTTYPFTEDCEKKFRDYQESLGFSMSDEQKAIVHMAVENSLTIISGGAGVGKTTTLEAIFEMLEYIGHEVMQIAFTGKAARRMEQATKRKAITIASFIQRIATGSLEDNTSIVIDEASMVCLTDAYNIFKRLPGNGKIILVGDPVQLAPLGAGKIFHALVEELCLKDYRQELMVVKRQVEESGIPAVANSIRECTWPRIPDYTGYGTGVQFLRCPENQVRNNVLKVFDDIGADHNDAIVLSPTKESGQACVSSMNQIVQERYRAGDDRAYYWNGYHESLSWSGYCVDDRVIFTRNDYQRELCNGSIGSVIGLYRPEAGQDKVMDVDYDGKIHPMMIEDLSDLSLAYSITIHKSQGSQFDRVIIPIYRTQLLDQSLLYTAVTRCVEQVILVGPEQLAERAVHMPASHLKRQVGFPILLKKLFNRT